MVYGIVAAFTFMVLTSFSNDKVDSGFNAGYAFPRKDFTEFLETGYIIGINIISRPDESDNFDVKIGTSFSQHYYSGKPGSDGVKIIEFSAGPNFYFRDNKIRYIGAVGWGIYLANPENNSTYSYLFNTGFYFGSGISISPNRKFQIDLIPKYHRLLYPGSHSYFLTLSAYIYFSIK